MNKYQLWIERYLERTPRLLGRCNEACAEMLAEFPELRIVRGHVIVAVWGKRGHVWLIDEEDSIVDPTAKQFPAILCYEPWKPGDEVRVGACMECGESIWEAVDSLEGDPPPNPGICSEECEQAIRVSLNGRLDW